MQRKNARLAAGSLFAASALVLGPFASQVWSQAGGGGGTGGAGTGAGGTAAGQSSSSQPSQQPASPSAPGAADERQSGASSTRPDAAGTRQSPGTSPPAKTGTGTQQPGGTAQPPPPPGSRAPESSADRNQADPNRATRDQDATRSRRTSGEARPFDFGAGFRATDEGLTVRTVREDGFFHNVGIQEGDRIISINGQEVTNEAQFRRLMLAGEGRFPVVVMRDGERKEIVVNARDLQTSAGGESSRAEQNGQRSALGVWFFSLPEGAHIVRVVPGSPAERAGLKVGDFIVSLNEKPCHDWQAVAQNVSEAEPESGVALQISRNGRTMPIQAKLGKYHEVFADPHENWNTIAAQTPQGQWPRTDAGQFDRRGGYWTGRANPSGDGYDQGAPNNQGARMQPAEVQHLERRIRQLEQEVANLREQLNRGTSTSAAAEDRNNGQRTNGPPNGR